MAANKKLIYTPGVMARIREAAGAGIPRDVIARDLGLRLATMEARCQLEGVKLPHKTKKPAAAAAVPSTYQRPDYSSIGPRGIEPHKYREPVKHEIELPFTVMLPASTIEKLKEVAKSSRISERALAAQLIIRNIAAWKID